MVGDADDDNGHTCCSRILWLEEGKDFHSGAGKASNAGSS